MSTTGRLPGPLLRLGFVCWLLPDAAAAATLQTMPLVLHASFQHTPSTGAPYATIASGVLDLSVIEQTGGTASATFVLGRAGCFLAASWQSLGSGGGITRPAEICIAAGAVTEAAFNSWMNLERSADPSLTVPLVPLPSPAGAWTNPTQVPAQVLARGCGNATYRKLADLRIDPGQIMVQTVPNPPSPADFVLSGAGIVLAASAAVVWSDVLSGCGGTAAGLPATPAPGTSVSVMGTTQQPPPQDPSHPHAQMEAMHAAVDGLVAGQVLTARQGKSLTRKVDGSAKKLRQARPASATNQLVRFEAATTALRDQGVLPGAVADSLLAQSGAARAAIGLLGIAPPLPRPDPDESCDPAPAVCPENLCAYTVYHVDARAGGLGLLPDGSAARPFRTIVDALARATADGRCGADLIVASGEYVGDILLDRNLRIHGSGPRTTIAGSLFSTGAYELVIEDVAMDPSGRAVYVSNPCASTSLLRVTITGAREYGVVQRGGALEVRGCTVSATESQADNVSRGTGIYLGCGVQAVMQSVTLEANAAAGLQVVGAGTRLTGRIIDVTHTGVHPTVAADPCTAAANFGALQVRLGAELDAELVHVTHNDLVGLFVAGADARATLRSSRLSRTAELPGGCGGGHNAMVIDDGALELWYFEDDHADLAGVLLARGGVADLHDGDVTTSTVGAAVQTEGFDLSRLEDGVRYIRNGRNLDTTELPVPGAVGSLDDP